MYCNGAQGSWCTAAPHGELAGECQPDSQVGSGGQFGTPNSPGMPGCSEEAKADVRPCCVEIRPRQGDPRCHQRNLRWWRGALKTSELRGKKFCCAKGVAHVARSGSRVRDFLGLSSLLFVGPGEL